MTQFTDRASYKAFRAEWKANYKQLTIDQRAAKIALKEAMRAYGKATTQPDRSKTWNDLYKAMSATNSLRYKANEMLQELAEAKIESQRQYLAEKETANV